ncbi:MAG: hypothetical protein NUW37_04830 [Planctomycetes bacterium]|nr:hypothetical protein [Planctomycetota bacterium]
MVNLDTESIRVLMSSHLSHLRSIKDMEMKWLTSFSAISLPGLGYLLATSAGSVGTEMTSLLIALVFYFCLTCWIQLVLSKERNSYYKVLRTVIRSQKLLGFFDANFLPSYMADAPFPKGIGEFKNIDSTQRCGSFLHRQLYTIFIFSLIVVVCVIRGLNSNAFFLLAMDIVWLIVLFRFDERDLYRDAINEKELYGADNKWYL